MVEKAVRALFHQGKEIHIGLSELLEQREMMVPLYVKDTDRIPTIENRAKYICQPASTTSSSTEIIHMHFSAFPCRLCTALNL